MLFSRVIVFFAPFATLGILALSSPVASGAVLAKRDNADIEEVFTTLKASTDSVLPQIRKSTFLTILMALLISLALEDIAASGNATEENITPLIGDLVSALNTASGSLSGLSASSVALTKRQSDSDIATLVASIITESHCIPCFFDNP